MLEINILSYIPHEITLGVLKGDFEGLGVQRMPRCPAGYDYVQNTMLPTFHLSNSIVQQLNCNSLS